MEGILLELHVAYVVDSFWIKLKDTVVLHFLLFCKKL